VEVKEMESQEPRLLEGDEVKVIAIEEGEAIALYREKDNQIFIIIPYCSCNSGWWWLEVFAVASPEKVKKVNKAAEAVYFRALQILQQSQK